MRYQTESSLVLFEKESGEKRELFMMVDACKGDNPKLSNGGSVKQVKMDTIRSDCVGEILFEEDDQIDYSPDKIRTQPLDSSL